MIWNICGGWTCFSLSDEMVEIVFIYVVRVANKLCLSIGEGKNVPINLFNAGELYPTINVLRSLGVMGSITLVVCLKFWDNERIRRWTAMPVKIKFYYFCNSVELLTVKVIRISYLLRSRGYVVGKKTTSSDEWLIWMEFCRFIRDS